MKLFGKKKESGKHLTEAERLHRFYVKFAQTIATTSKQLIWVFSINGIAWIWCSYILAFMGKEQIAEALSGNVCDVVIGQVGLYLITSTVEKVFQYNYSPEAKTKTMQAIEKIKQMETAPPDEGEPPDGI